MLRESVPLAGVAFALVAVFATCAGDERGRDTPSIDPSLSVPMPVEEVALTAAVTRILGPHALEIGHAPTLVIVVDGVPSSLRAGDEVRATGTVRVFHDGLGEELGISLGPELASYEGTECLVVARLVILDR